MNNRDIAHKFFYEHKNDTNYTANNTSFFNDVFCSYYTCIGYIYTNKTGKKTLMLSNSNFSNTTAKHISYLRQACPFDVLYVPMQYGENMKYKTPADRVKFTAGLLAEQIANEIKAKKTYTRKADRDSAQDLQATAENFCKVTGEKIKGLAKYNKYIGIKLNTEEIKKANAKARALAKAKAEKTKKLIAKMQKRLANVPLLDSVNKYIFDFVAYKATPEEIQNRDIFIKSFEIENPSFVTIDAAQNQVKTSQGVYMDIDTIKPFLRAWQAGRNIHGLKIGYYTILENNAQHVKIGCHNIPTANIKALADMLL